MNTDFIKKIDGDWTLFLDRDGVLNYDTPGDYVRNWSKFNFFDTTLSAMEKLANIFNLILIVTNQRGVGLGLMTQQNLDEIHQNMLAEIIANNGRIDKIYYSTDTDKINSTHRKPSTGMGLQAKQDFNEIDFSCSIMVGNNISDMQFGRNLGMYTIFIDDRKEYNNQTTDEMDLIFNNLLEMADFIEHHFNNAAI
jgi:histidinol-phosphate phosphatase family protein